MVKIFAVTALGFSFLGMQDPSGEKVAILFVNPIGETTLISIFRTNVATGYS